jgi:hypothetical protein
VLLSPPCTPFLRWLSEPASAAEEHAFLALSLARLLLPLKCTPSLRWLSEPASAAEEHAFFALA